MRGRVVRSWSMRGAQCQRGGPAGPAVAARGEGVTGIWHLPLCTPVLAFSFWLHSFHSQASFAELLLDGAWKAKTHEKHTRCRSLSTTSHTQSRTHTRFNPHPGQVSVVDTGTRAPVGRGILRRIYARYMRLSAMSRSRGGGPVAWVSLVPSGTLMSAPEHVRASA